jgi:hypothetical protein
VVPLTVGSSSQATSARRATELGLRKYDVLIHVSRVEEFVRFEEPEVGRRRGVPVRRFEEGPAHPGVDGGPTADGFWTSRSMPWQHGVPDQRRGSAGHGRVGALAWQLPHMEPQVRRDQRIHALARSSPEKDSAGPRLNGQLCREPLRSPHADPVGLGGLGIGDMGPDVDEVFESGRTGSCDGAPVHANGDVEAAEPSVSGEKVMRGGLRSPPHQDQQVPQVDR